MSATCAICGRERAHSANDKSHWLSKLGYGLAYATILSPIAILLAAFPFFPIRASKEARRYKPLRMCQICEWLFGAFTFVVALILIGVAYVIWSTRGA